MPSIPTKTREYVFAARALAHDDGRSWPRHLVCLARTRLAHNIGPADYVACGMYALPTSAFGKFLKKKSLEALQAAVNLVEVRPFADDKLRFWRHCVDAGLPVPRLHAVVGAAEPGLVGEIPVLRDAAPLARILAALPPGTAFVIKPTDGDCGRGVLVLARADHGDGIVERGAPLSPADVAEQIIAVPDQVTWLVQKRITAHPDLRPIMAGDGVGTVRAVTLHDGAALSILHCSLRITAAGAVADNFNHGESSNLLGDIDLEHGTLVRAWWRDRRAHRFLVREQPTQLDTGASLAGVALPCWPETIAAILKAAEVMGDLPTLGFDVAITPRGPVFLEANWRWDPGLPQVARRQGPRPAMERFAAERRGLQATLKWNTLYKHLEFARHAFPDRSLGQQPRTQAA